MIDSARAVRDWLGSGADDARIADQVDAVLAFEARLANVSRYLVCVCVCVLTVDVAAAAVARLLLLLLSLLLLVFALCAHAHT